MLEDIKYSNKKSDSDRTCASVECDPRGHRPRHINPSDGDAKPQLAGDSHALLTFFTPRKPKSTISLPAGKKVALTVESLIIFLAVGAVK